METDTRFRVIPAQSTYHVIAAQSLDDQLWTSGFQHYQWLFEHEDQNRLLVALDNESEKFLGYIGVERFQGALLCAAQLSGFKESMPPWNHDPNEYDSPHGEVYHITGAGVIREARKMGVFEALVEDMVSRARGELLVSMVASTYNLRHPQIPNPQKVWGRVGFKPMTTTYDPNWNHDGENNPKDQPDDGAIVWARSVNS